MSEKKKTILLADDDPDVIYVMKHHLQSWGYEVVAVDSRLEAERYLESEFPDLAILDLMMEEEDSGFILSYRIKKNRPHLPVIISTSVAAESGIHFDVTSPGGRSWIRADHYLEKGFKMEQLKMLVRKYLG
jgi:CheY-like chemotaxis protein